VAAGLRIMGSMVNVVESCVVPVWCKQS